MIKFIESLGISASPYINAAVFTVVFILVAKAAGHLIVRIFRAIAKHKKPGMDESIIAAMHRPVFFTVVALGVSIASRFFEKPEKFVFYLDGAVYSFVAVLWMLCAIRISGTIIENAMGKFSNVTGLSNDVVPLIRNLTKIVIVIVALIVVLGVWHVNITPVLASAGIAGVAVALAAKDTIANFFGGISIFVDRPFIIGDYIVLEGGDRGEVVNIGIRSTKVKTLDDVLITVPNSTIINSKISNESVNTTYLRLRLPVSAAYGSDIDSVEKVLVEIALEDEGIVKDPAPLAMMIAFGELGLNFELVCWIKSPVLRPVVLDRVNRRIYNKFRELGIGIPFAQSDVYVVQAKR